MDKEFLSAVIVLTLVTDPFGNMPLVNAMLSGVHEQRRRVVVARECAIAYGLLLAFMFGGQSFLSLMHLSQTSLSIAGGVILFMIAIRMVFAKMHGTFGAEGQGEPFIVPLAIPLIAGAISVTMALTTVVLLAGTKLHRWLGEHAMQAIERLMGLILTAIAVEMLLAGIRDFLKSL
jgi:small neutral amino acid transporter SnatA (MarC family)